MGENMDKIPRIGVSCLLYNKDLGFLLGLRKGSHEAGKWSCPGGHLEENETPEECIIREVFEETGIIINNITPLTFKYEEFPESNKRYINLVYYTEVDNNVKAELKEPDKCEEWRWIKDTSGYKLFLGLESVIELFLEKYNDTNI